MAGIGVLTGTSLVTSDSQPYSLWVGGLDIIRPIGAITAGVPVDSIVIEDSGLNTPGRLRFTLEDPTQTVVLRAASEVVLRDNVNDLTLFGGYLVSRKMKPRTGVTKAGPQSARPSTTPSCSTSSWFDTPPPQAFGRTSRPSSRSLADTAASLSVTSATVSQTASPIPSLEFIDLTLRQAIERIADAAGDNRVYWVDADKRLWYTLITTPPIAPYVITDNPIAGDHRVAENVTLDWDDDITTAVYVQGGNAAGSGWYYYRSAMKEYPEFTREEYLSAPDAINQTMRDTYALSHLLAQVGRSLAARSRFSGSTAGSPAAPHHHQRRHRPVIGRVPNRVGRDPLRVGHRHPSIQGQLRPPPSVGHAVAVAQ